MVDDLINANGLLYQRDPKSGKTEHPDHMVVIKYMPVVGDSKRAIDECRCIRAARSAWVVIGLS